LAEYQGSSSTCQYDTCKVIFDWEKFSDERSDLPFDRQFVCGSGISTSLSEYRSNEIICFKTDASCQVLVVAPVMTDPTGVDYSIVRSLCSL
jgi:hypothetical protein